MKINKVFLCAYIALFLSASPALPFEKTSALSDAVRTKENMEPTIPRPDQDAAAAKKLADLQG